MKALRRYRCLVYNPGSQREHLGPLEQRVFFFRPFGWQIARDMSNS
jgi:hypothetical protein